MTGLTPSIAAGLASEAYEVQSDVGVKFFMSRSEFSSADREKISLKAEVGSRLINTQDGFGLCALGGDRYQGDIFLIFRGSTAANRGADWASNARIGVEFSKTGMPVHLGFNHVFCSMLDQIKAFLAQHSGAIGTVHCIGHSLGGAIATLAADWVKSNRGNPVSLYTFGAPRPGLWLFAQRFQSRLGVNNIYRVYHATDPIPMVPLYPFVHSPLSSDGYQLPSNATIISAQAHSRRLYVESVSKKGWPALHGPMSPYKLEHLVEEWLSSKTRPNPADPRTWEWLNAALAYVLKKVLGGAALTLQAGFVSFFTLADKIAWILHKGIDLAGQFSSWVYSLMRKIMQVLGMAVAKTAEELTQSLMRTVLMRLMEKVTSEAQRALRNVFRS